MTSPADRVAVQHLMATVFRMQHALVALAPEYKWRGLRHLRGQRVDSNGVLMWNQGHSSLVAGSRDSEVNAVLPGKRRPTFRRHDRSPRTKPPSSAPSDAL